MEATDKVGIPYAELHAHSNFSFLDGASSPEALVAEAMRLRLNGLALTDHDGFYGVVRFAEAAEIATRTATTVTGASQATDLHDERKPTASTTTEATPQLATVFGAELSLGLTEPQNGIPDPEGSHLLVLARGPSGYHRLSSAITEAQLDPDAEKGHPVYHLDRLADCAGDDWVILTGCRKGAVRQELTRPGIPRTLAAENAGHELDRLVELFGHKNVFVELYDHGDPLASDHNDALAMLAASRHLPVIATGNVHYATPNERHLATAVAAVRSRRSLDEIDGWLPAAGSAYLRSGAEMAARFCRYPGAVEHTVDLATDLAFSLRKVKPRLPKLDVPAGHTPMSWLRELVCQGVAQHYSKERYPGFFDEVQERMEKELRIIEEKDFPGYFLIVYDIVQYARGQGILCQGRGSAANSAVCYVLGITAVDAIFYRLPFERFLSSMREEEPDIDVDFDSRRREEVIQYVYERYGRRSAAQVANVISYRPKAAVRDMAKALGASPGQQDAWSKHIERHDSDFAYSGVAHREPAGREPAGRDTKGREPAGRDTEGRDTAGREPKGREPAGRDTKGRHTAGNDRADTKRSDPDIPASVIDLAASLMHAPRHLGIHSGGMVLTERPVGEIVPIEHARMDGRTVLQWDKQDVEWMGLVKFDLLGLGMLEALQYMFELIQAGTGEQWELASLPKEEPAVYDMLCRADALGVFQVESRAQLATLPRLKPRRFYDLVIEIALIRPGPIQGGAVHPYIRRRAGEEPVSYPHPKLEAVLKRTLGVPLFQEQAIQMAVACGCTAEEAEMLRRAMGSKRGKEKISALRARLFEAMAAGGFSPEMAQSMYEKIEAFSGFGFAESHSLSFALLVYASAWLKLHYPAAFLAGLIRAQPMGFYSPQTLTADAVRHGVEVRHVDILHSGAYATLEAFALPKYLEHVRNERDESTKKLSPSSLPQPPTGMAECLAWQLQGTGDSNALDESTPFDPSSPDETATHRRDGHLAVRLGLAEVRGIGVALAERIVTERESAGPYRDQYNLASRVPLTVEQLETLAAAGAFESFGRSRREELWVAGDAAREKPDQLPGTVIAVQPPLLPLLSPAEQLAYDLWATGISPGDHPLRYLRAQLAADGILSAEQLREAEPDRRTRVAGVVTHRQRPSTAGGITFINLEDETGQVNVVVSRGTWLRYRRIARQSPALTIRGMLQRSPEGVISIVADRLEPLPITASTHSRDFR